MAGGWDEWVGGTGWRPIAALVLHAALAASMLLSATAAASQTVAGTAPTQEAAKPEAPPAAAQAQTPQIPPRTAEAQQPGAGAQVQTGSQFGQQSFANRLARLLADHQFLEMETLLNAADQGTAGRLTAEQKQLFQGVLANRENKELDSIALLAPLEESWKAGANPGEEKLLRRTLAEDYLRAGEWAKASQAYRNYAGDGLSPEEKAEIELPLKLLPLAGANPPMTVEPGDAFALPYDRDPLGLTDVPVFVDGVSRDWMLDPTAPFNLVSRSTARQVGLKLSDDSATVTGITGRPMTVHATVIPRFTLGTFTFRNMTAFVFEDADYYFAGSRYQVRGVLGYPAVSALGSLTVTADARIEVQPGDKGERLTSGARFFLDGDRLIAALGQAGDERMFVLDAGGQQTYLTSRYYAEHSEDFAGKKMHLITLAGESDQTPVPAYVAESAALQIGATLVTFHFLPVLTQPLGGVALDDTYGTLGMDALDELKSYTFDYRTMRFAVKAE